MPTNLSIKQIADYQMLNAFFNSDLGLFDGKTGIALFFFIYARRTHNPWYEDFAGELLDNICENLHARLPITFADGLCGIGWGIEFMKRRGFIEGDTDEILIDLDRKIMERDLRRISDTSFETGLEGIAIYMRSRVDSIRSAPNDQLFDPVYIADLEAACRKAGIGWHLEQYETEAVWHRVLDGYSTASFAGKDNWKRGLSIIGANYG